MHSGDAVGSEAHASTDLGKGGGGFEEVGPNDPGGGVLKDPEEKGKPADAAADYGEAEGWDGGLAVALGGEHDEILYLDVCCFDFWKCLIAGKLSSYKS